MNVKTTTFEEYLGEFKGVKAYSNGESLYISNQNFYLSEGKFKHICTGMKYQCVEYARRWLILTENMSFESIDFAYDIWSIKSAVCPLKVNQSINFLNYQNTNSIPPQVGDLIIYNKSKLLPYGHVAIISEVDINSGYVSVAEANYLNLPWENQTKYSRKILLTKNLESYNLSDKEEEIIGWKRLNK